MTVPFRDYAYEETILRKYYLTTTLNVLPFDSRTIFNPF